MREARIGDVNGTILDVGGLPASGSAIVKAMTTNTAWDTSETLQFYLGNNATLSTTTGDGRTIRHYFNQEFDGGATSPYAYSAMTRRAFTMLDSVAGANFVETATVADAEFILLSASDRSNGTEGISYFPGTFYKNSEFFTLTIINHAGLSMKASAELGGGAYANWTIIHEIGHALGLEHSFGTLKINTAVGDALDNERYTVMSYDGASFASRYGHAVSPMALDIACIQGMYGKSTYAAGNSSYRLMDPQGGALDLAEGNVQIGRAYYCIWDSGVGDVDELSYQGSSRSVLINLNDATLDRSQMAADAAEAISIAQTTAYFQSLSAGLRREMTNPDYNAGGFFSRVLKGTADLRTGEAGGFSIAYGVTIENATGGARGDLLIGNEAGNVISGLGGADTAIGADGNDILRGGLGADRLYGGSGNDMLEGQGGNDRLTGGDSADTFVFEAGTGTDTITDFENLDKIDVSAFGLAQSALEAAIASVSGDAVITLGGGDVIIVTGKGGALVLSDFLF